MQLNARFAAWRPADGTSQELCGGALIPSISGHESRVCRIFENNSWQWLSRWGSVPASQTL